MKPWSIIYSVASVLYWVFLDYIQHKLLHIRKLYGLFLLQLYKHKKNHLQIFLRVLCWSIQLAALLESNSSEF